MGVNEDMEIAEMMYNARTVTSMVMYLKLAKRIKIKKIGPGIVKRKDISKKMLWFLRVPTERRSSKKRRKKETDETVAYVYEEEADRISHEREELEDSGSQVHVIMCESDT